MSEPYDTVFSLPSVDDDPDTEIAVLLMGLGPERLLAGLGVASGPPAGDAVLDPATVTLLVDQLRHGARDDLTFESALAAGARRWRAAREALDRLVPGTQSAALRQQWAAAVAEVGGARAPQLRTISAAEHVYLVACWLRSVEVTRVAEENRVVPELPA